MSSKIRFWLVNSWIAPQHTTTMGQSSSLSTTNDNRSQQRGSLDDVVYGGAMLFTLGTKHKSRQQEEEGREGTKGMERPSMHKDTSMVARRHRSTVGRNMSRINGCIWLCKIATTSDQRPKRSANQSGTSQSNSTLHQSQPRNTCTAIGNSRKTSFSQWQHYQHLASQIPIHWKGSWRGLQIRPHSHPRSIAMWQNQWLRNLWFSLKEAPSSNT